MTLLTSINITLNELEDLRINQELSWDEIGIKIGKSRNTIKRAVITMFGEDAWKKLVKFESIKDLVPEDTQQKQTVTQSNPTKPVEEPKQEETKEPYFKYFMSSVDDNSVIVTVYLDGEKYSKTIGSSAMLLKVNQAIQDKDFEALKTYLSIEETFKQAGISFDQIANQYSIAKINLTEGARELIMKCYEETINGEHDSIKGLVSMIHSLNKVKKIEVLEQLYGFLKHNDVTILDDGSFICYKYITKLSDGTYVDSYSKSVTQQVGDYIYTHENKVNNNPNITCSYGLHCAAWQYVNGQSTIAKVRVLPEDVVSVPVDYNGSKLRCKGYTVLEIKDNKPTLGDFSGISQLDLIPKNNVYVDATGYNKEKN